MDKIRIQVNKEWYVEIKVRDKKYLEIESDCDLAIWPCKTNHIVLSGGEEDEKSLDLDKLHEEWRELRERGWKITFANYCKKTGYKE